jgi:predicted DNA-binding protein with PD1-like motif
VNPRPIRLLPGVDLRRELERLVNEHHVLAGFIVVGIGSLTEVAIRFAQNACPTILSGPHEILTLAGSLSRDGAHLHVTVASGNGQVIGGHLAYGNRVGTTAEILLLETPDWPLQRELDEATGYLELVVGRTTLSPSD